MSPWSVLPLHLQGAGWPDLITQGHMYYRDPASPCVGVLTPNFIGPYEPAYSSRFPQVIKQRKGGLHWSIYKLYLLRQAEWKPIWLPLQLPLGLPSSFSRRLRGKHTYLTPVLAEEKRLTFNRIFFLILGLVKCHDSAMLSRTPLYPSFWMDLLCPSVRSLFFVCSDYSTTIQLMARL